MRLRRFCFFVCFLLLSGLCLTAQATQRHDPFARLFGYKAVPAEEKDFPFYIERQWTRVLNAEQATPSLLRGASCLPPVDAPHWLYLAGKAHAMSEMDLLRSVSAFFNKFPPASDMRNYGVHDRWPTLADFFGHRSGDCKAYALSKYFALRALDVQDDKLRIVLVRIPRRAVNHAVLAVAVAKGVFILDNLSRPKDLILPQEKFHSHYIPLLMLNEKGRWLFQQGAELLPAE
jgi:predicted transglutaminase-like cysteine proteinase